MKILGFQTFSATLKYFNPIWTGLFPNLNSQGGGEGECPPPDLTISSQITVVVEWTLLVLFGRH